MGDLTDYAVNLILDGRLGEAEDALLVEGMEDKLIKQVGGVSQLEYMLKFAAYLDNHDIQLFDGWDDMVLYKPEVRQFWVIIYGKVSKKTDLKFLHRIMTDKEDQNEVRQSKLDDGSIMLRFKMLRRLLDQIEIDDRQNTEEIADDQDPTIEHDK